MRVAYVDNDPVVQSHVRALLAGDGIAAISADITRPADVLADPGLRPLRGHVGNVSAWPLDPPGRTASLAETIGDLAEKLLRPAGAVVTEHPVSTTPCSVTDSIRYWHVAASR